MTPEQIEAAARELLRKRGMVDPFDYFDLDDAKSEVRRFVEVGQAIAAVAELPRKRKGGT